jgi:hypothetical protein
VNQPLSTQNDDRGRGGPFVDLTGRQFGRLTALRLAEGRSRDGRRLWQCRCACGAELVADSRRLQIGDKQCCGHRCPLRPRRADLGGLRALRTPWAALAERLRAEGKTMPQIAAVVGVTRQRVHQVLNALEKRKAAGQKG